MKLLTEMVVFASVVDHKGFAMAARQLGMTASAVSRSVARLEAHLGVKLLNRTTRSLSLTEQGTDVYANCTRIAQAARVYLGYGAFRDRLDMACDGTQASTQISGPLTINSSLGILTTVEAGLGIGIVPDFAAATGLRDGRLVRVLPDWSLEGAYAKRTVHAVYSPTRYLPQKVRILIDHLVAAAQCSKFAQTESNPASSMR